MKFLQFDFMIAHYTFDSHVELFAKNWELGGENPKQKQRQCFNNMIYLAISSLAILTPLNHTFLIV